MAVHTTDVHLARGEFRVDCEFSEATKHLTRLHEDDGVTRRYPHLRIYRDHVLRYGGILHSRPTCNRRGITLRGCNFRFLLGDDQVGSPVVDRTYWSGKQKLSNGSFEFVSPHEWGSYSLREGTAWGLSFIGPGAAHDGNIVAGVAQDPTEDDVIISEEPFEVRQGEQYLFQAFAYRDSGFNRSYGRLRARVVLEGRFSQPELLSDHDFEPGTGQGWTMDPTVSITLDEANSLGGRWVMRFDPIPRPQLITNPSFENWAVDLSAAQAWGNGWYAPSGIWYEEHTAPAHGLTAVSVTAPEPGGGPGPALRKLESYRHEPGAGNPYHDVSVGETWRLSSLIRSWPNTNGRAKVSALLWTANFDPADAPSHRYAETHDLDPRANQAAAGSWRQVSTDIEIQAADPDEPENQVIGLIAVCEVGDLTLGTWSFDNTTLTRVKGNYARATRAPVAVTPEQSYHIEVPALFTPSPEPGSGAMRLSVRLFAPGRPELVVDGTEVTDEEAGPKLLQLDLTPPSGYDIAHLTIVGRDLLAPVFCDRVGWKQTDTTRKFYDGPTPAFWSSWHIVGVLVDIPSGATSMHVEVVAEAGSQGWLLDDLQLRAHNVNPKTAAGIVVDLLLDPVTGDLTVPFGRLFGNDTLQYDWRLKFINQGPALEQLATSGLLQPNRESRINADGRYEFGLPAEIYTDHSNVVLRNDDHTVIEPLDTDESNEGAADGVVTIGSDHIGSDGINRPTFASALNPSTSTTHAGRPVRRLRLVQDSTLEHVAHAEAFAKHLAERELPVPQVSRVRLSDPEGRGFAQPAGVVAPPVVAGDWVHLWDPASGLEDADATRLLHGETVRPVRKRVFAVDQDYGPSAWRVTIYDPVTREETPLEGVVWSSDDIVELEVGEWRREFVDDPTAGSTEAQFLRYRTAGGRF